MKKIIIILIILFALLSGCKNSNVIESASDPITATNTYDASCSQDFEIDAFDEYKYFHTLLRQEIENASLNFINGAMQEAFNESALINEIKTISATPCKLSKDTTAMCILLSVPSTENLSFWFIAIDVNNAVMFQPINLNMWETPEIYFADLDGDQLDEIITHSMQLIFSRDGPFYQSAVYKWSGNTLNPLYYSDASYIAFTDQINWIDSGLQMKFGDDYKCIVEYKYTGTQIVFNAKGTPIYNGDGEFNNPLDYIHKDEPFFSTRYGTNNFLLFEPVDIDYDGVYEILAMEPFFMEYQMSRNLGAGYYVLKLIPSANKLEIIKSSFWSYLYENKHSQWDKQQEFESNWYK